MNNLKLPIFKAWLTGIICTVLMADAGLAQIVPDNSLGAENSQVNSRTLNGLPVDLINGGATRGANLFHSFSDFNIPENRAAYFTNPTGITNIFSRVTGSNPSNILGILGVQGNANLFLLNPQGIIFGPNAALDVKGTFLGSSADSIVFNNGYQFSSQKPESVPLLNVNIPLGLNFRDNPGKIINQSTLPAPAASLVGIPETFIDSFKNIGLAVRQGQTISLVGGEIELNKGVLTAPSGQVLLGSVSKGGFVGFTQTPLGLSLNYDQISQFGDIKITNGIINASGAIGGKIELQGDKINASNAIIRAFTFGNGTGRDIDIRANSVLIDKSTGISTFILGTGTGGSINIKAQDSVQVVGVSVDNLRQLIDGATSTKTVPIISQIVSLSTATNGSGKAGNISIETNHLQLSNGGLIASLTLGSGKGGDVVWRANSIDLITSVVSSGALFGSTGDGGDIRIDTNRLTLREGSSLSSTTTGPGNSGNILINATEGIEMLRTPTGAALQGVLSTSSIGAGGKAGNIIINTGSLVLEDGVGLFSTSGGTLGDKLFSPIGGPGGNIEVRASSSVKVSGISGVLTNQTQIPSAITAFTTNQSNGGSISITTPQLTVSNGGLITTGSAAGGKAGDINIHAPNLEVSGSANNGQFISRIEAASGRVFGNLNPQATGNAGSINLKSEEISVTDKATINVSSLGVGAAGTLNIQTNNLLLDNQGIIDATTGSGAGGNININAQQVRLRRSSRISSDAGSSEGGNISLNSNFLVAFPQENSDITANAQTGAGGRVLVNVANIFGAAGISREQVRSNLGLNDAEFALLKVNPTTLLSSSDIAAISQASGPSLQGTVTFSTSGVNPIQGLVELPENVVDPTALVVSNPCTNQANRSQFTVAGKGGLPASPLEVLNSNFSSFPWVEAAEPTVNNSSQNSHTTSEITNYEPVVPAQGWAMNERGQVILLGYNQGEAIRSYQPVGTCQTPTK